MYKPGSNKYVPPAAKKIEAKPTELKESDFPEFISVSKKAPTISYSALINPVKEEAKPIEVAVSNTKGRRVVVKDMGDRKEDELMNRFIELQMPDFTEYYKRRDKRLKEEEQRRRQRLYGSLSEEELTPEEDNDSDTYAPEDEEDNDNLEEYDPSEFDRHR